MNTKEMNIKELELVNGGKEDGYFTCNPVVPCPKPINPINRDLFTNPQPIGPIQPDICPLQPFEIPYGGDEFVCFTMC